MLEDDFEDQIDVDVIVGSLYLKDAEQIVEGIPNVTGIQLDVTDNANLFKRISQVDVVISLLPPSCHIIVADACIQLKKHLVTASYVDSSMSMLDDKAKDAGITILGEMGLDPGIGMTYYDIK
ncbi:alpha-aminoadipic semialdehyde synthase-like protein [Trifolium pratense]|uniref:Alpha-aminoadipic semialdehyde synthase-like protein n=1 Tax=Trifolium pratense TaxID=57577 RepID=A0A2K3KAZ4_TRIPR|nr:alpha-aminoadipic semialdehyde synthase-like protein [Trifolium pratense]